MTKGRSDFVILSTNFKWVWAWLNYLSYFSLFHIKTD